MKAKVSFSHSPQNTLIIAHRGASGYLPEHSLAAKSLAFFQGADFIEQDVVLTKDNIPIVIHDIYLETVTNVKEVFPQRARQDGRFYAIDFTLAEVKRLLLHERTDPKTGKAVYPNRFPSDLLLFQIPTLEEELSLIRALNQKNNKKVGVYVEIKKPEFHKNENKDISLIVLKVLQNFSYEKHLPQVFIQCFHADTLIRLKKLTPIPLIQLIADDSWQESSDNFAKMLTRKGLEHIATYAYGIGPWWPQLLQGFKKARPLWSPLIANARELGLKIHSYTFRKEEVPKEMKSFSDFITLFLKSSAIDGMFTDYPLEVVNIRKPFIN